MTKEEAKRFGLHLLQGIMERNESYPVYANNVKQAIDALSESGSSEIPNDLEEAAKEYAREYTDSDNGNGGDDWEDDIKITFIAGAKWQKEQDDKELSEKITAAYQLGLADKEKQMMKEAVEAHIYQSVNPISEVGHQLHQVCLLYEDKENAPYLKAGDKVKIIIVKEDEK